MKHIYVRPLRLYDEQDKAAFVEAADTCGKEFPKDVFTLPSTRIMVAEAGGQVILYQPHYLSLNLGSLIPLPHASYNMLAAAQHMLVASAFTRVHAEGLADIIALSNNTDTRSFAQRHGFMTCSDMLRMEVR